jgi:hypothetical protein
MVTERHYPLLGPHCKVVLRPETAIAAPPVRLPAEVLASFSAAASGGGANNNNVHGGALVLPPVYDFSLGA